jgi:hypothetical protein
MPKSNEEIRKSIAEWEKKLPESERNPNAKQHVEQILKQAAQPLESKPGKPRRSGGYTGKQTRSRKAEDTSD